jgi:hypothetical protein
MCTVTVVPNGTGFRLACNRDERRTRPAADPPNIRSVAGGTAVWPADPVSGGTWIAVNDCGVAMALLNRNPRINTSRDLQPRSRGTIIPQLIGRQSLESVLAAATGLTSTEFEPFTLLVLHGTQIAVLTSAGGRLSFRSRVLSQPLLFTSSSLGDHVVLQPRRALFEAMVKRSEHPLRGQAAFHRHRWKSRPEVSVCMSRADAATVSLAVIDVGAHEFSMCYTALGSDSRADLCSRTHVR